MNKTDLLKLPDDHIHTFEQLTKETVMNERDSAKFVCTAKDLKDLVREVEEVLKEKHRKKKCLHCHRQYRNATAKLKHESKCFLNPNRVCETCDGSGLIDEILNNGYMGHKNHPCYDCETAKRALTERTPQ